MNTQPHETTGTESRWPTLGFIPRNLIFNTFAFFALYGVYYLVRCLRQLRIRKHRHIASGILPANVSLFFGVASAIIYYILNAWALWLQIENGKGGDGSKDRQERLMRLSAIYAVAEYANRCTDGLLFLTLVIITHQRRKDFIAELQAFLPNLHAARGASPAPTSTATTPSVVATLNTPSPPSVVSNGSHTTSSSTVAPASIPARRQNPTGALARRYAELTDPATLKSLKSRGTHIWPFFYVGVILFNASANLFCPIYAYWQQYKSGNQNIVIESWTTGRCRRTGLDLGFHYWMYLALIIVGSSAWSLRGHVRRLPRARSRYAVWDREGFAWLTGIITFVLWVRIYTTMPQPPKDVTEVQWYIPGFWTLLVRSLSYFTAVNVVLHEKCARVPGLKPPTRQRAVRAAHDEESDDGADRPVDAEVGLGALRLSEYQNTFPEVQQEREMGTEEETRPLVDV